MGSRTVPGVSEGIRPCDPDLIPVWLASRRKLSRDPPGPRQSTRPAGIEAVRSLGQGRSLGADGNRRIVALAREPQRDPVVMFGRVIKGQNNVPVARIMACVEVTMRVGPASDFSHVSALVDALLDWPMGHVVRVCDNRDFFQIRPIESSDLRLVRNALRVACGMEDPRTV